MIRTGRPPVLALFAVYLVLLVWVVVWKLEVPYVGAAALLPRPITLIPFVASADAGASAPPELLANVALFIPFGVYLGLLAPAWRGWQAVLVVAGASTLLETAQHLLSVGSFDTTDVLTNTAGGAAGLALVVVLRRRGATGPLATACAVGTVLALVAVGLFLVLPHHVPQHDVIVGTTSR